MWWLAAFLTGTYTGRKCPYLANPIEQKGDELLNTLWSLWETKKNEPPFN